MSDTLPERENQTMEEEANEREIRRIRRARLGKAGIQFDKTLNEFREKYDIDATTDYCDECKGRPHAPWCSLLEAEQAGKKVAQRHMERDGVITSEHQVTKSGTCIIPGCPCRGWSAQETANDVTGAFRQSRMAKYPAKVLAELTTAGELNNEQYQRLRRETVDTEHQPAARGGGNEWEYRETRYGAEAKAGNFVIRLHWTGLADIGDTRGIIQQIVTEHNQHQSLAAERERLKSALELAVDWMRGKRGGPSEGLMGEQVIKRLESTLATASEKGGPQ